MGSTWVGEFWFVWLIGVWLSGCKEQEGRVLVMQDFC